MYNTNIIFFDKEFSISFFFSQNVKNFNFGIVFELNNYINLKKLYMKQILSKLLFSAVAICLVAQTVTAANVAAENPFTFNPTVTSAPNVVIPYLPLPTEKTTLLSALKEYKSISKSEKKARIAEAKKQLKEYKKTNKSDRNDDRIVLLVILAIILPPLAVYLHEGEINNKFWISLLLTLLFLLPGIIYALYVILNKKDNK